LGFIMKITREDLFHLNYCYAVKHIDVDDETYILFAPEIEDKAYAYNLNTRTSEVIWDGPSGTMCFVPLTPNRLEFLAVQRFYSGFNAQQAMIVWTVRHDNGEWETKPLLELPFVHRFEILNSGDEKYIVCGILCKSKANKDDWSDPGCVLVGRLPDDLNKPIELTPLKEGLTRHHGLSKICSEDGERILVAADQGVFEISPSKETAEQISIKQIFDAPCSEATLFDIDGDGSEELITIEPFHGQNFNIYSKRGETWEEVYKFPHKMAFGHVLWTWKIRSVPSIIGGYRGEDRGLFILQFDRETGYQVNFIDKQGGPSNIDVIQGDTCDYLAVANREVHTASLYSIS
jgi:hypothetical protein